MGGFFPPFSPKFRIEFLGLIWALPHGFYVTPDKFSKYPQAWDFSLDPLRGVIDKHRIYQGQNASQNYRIFQSLSPSTSNPIFLMDLTERWKSQRCTASEQTYTSCVEDTEAFYSPSEKGFYYKLNHYLFCLACCLANKQISSLEKPHNVFSSTACH